MGGSACFGSWQKRYANCDGHQPAELPGSRGERPWGWALRTSSGCELIPRGRPTPGPGKSLIVFWTHGGMSQQDTYDLKTRRAPAEFPRPPTARLPPTYPAFRSRSVFRARLRVMKAVVHRPLGQPPERDFNAPLGPLDADRFISGRRWPGMRPRSRPSARSLLALAEPTSLWSRPMWPFPRPRRSGIRARSTLGGGLQPL